MMYISIKMKHKATSTSYENFVKIKIKNFKLLSTVMNILVL